MGIDVYLRWKGQTREEKENQYTGYLNAGADGYLREGFNQNYFATDIMFPKAKFGKSVKISNEILAARLPAMEKLYREKGESEEEIQHWRDFVALHSKLEREGKLPRIEVR